MVNYLFKKGDRVRCIKSDGKHYLKDVIYTVLGVGRAGGVYINTYEDGWYYPEENFMLVDDKCGKCSSKCRSDNGKCGLYSEETQ